MTRRFVLVLVTFALVASACGSSGPNLRAAINNAEAATASASAATLGVSADGADGVWSAEGTTAEVADAIATQASPDERSDDAGGDVFLLYRSGTVWVSDAEAEGSSAVILYDDNDRAYNRHSGILLLNRRWGTRINDYRSSGSSRSNSGNGFRGGGSSGGK